MINAPKHMKDLDIKRDVIYMPPNARSDKKDFLRFKHLWCKKLRGDYMLEKHGNEGWQVANGI